jgi:hypothetical protein
MASDKNAMLGTFQRFLDIDASKSDTVDLPQVALKIYVGAVGNVKITGVDGDTFTFLAVPAGTILPVMAKRVFVTGTTATALCGLYNTNQ